MHPAQADIAIVGGGRRGAGDGDLRRRRGGPRTRIVVLDGARTLGAKILVSGGGRCNVTNRDRDGGGFQRRLPPGDRARSCARCRCRDTIAFFEGARRLPARGSARQAVSGLQPRPYRPRRARRRVPRSGGIGLRAATRVATSAAQRRRVLHGDVGRRRRGTLARAGDRRALAARDRQRRTRLRHRARRSGTRSCRRRPRSCRSCSTATSTTGLAGVSHEVPLGRRRTGRARRDVRGPDAVDAHRDQRARGARRVASPAAAPARRT